MIPVNRPVVSAEAKANVYNALETNWLSSSGPFVGQFEERFAAWLGVRHAVAVSSGTAALHVAMLALGVGPGDEVVVPAFTMASTWLAVMHAGARPVFVDCSLVDFGMDVDKIGEKITERTKAIIATHLYGLPCDIGRIAAIADRHKLPVVEDACEAIGSLYRERRCGTFGKVSCFSFFSNKVIATGEGGMLATDDGEIADKARSFRDLCHSKQRFVHGAVGYNYRMTNLQAAVGCGEMGHVGEYVARKVAIGECYNRELAGVDGLFLPRIIRGRDSSYWMYAVLVDKLSFGTDRDGLEAELAEKGVETRRLFYPPEDQPALKGVIAGDEAYPNARYLSRNGLYLPSGLGTTDGELADVVVAVKEIHKKHKKYGNR